MTSKCFPQYNTLCKKMQRWVWRFGIFHKTEGEILTLLTIAKDLEICYTYV